MIDYEIVSLNTKLMSMQVKYSLEGKPDYFVRVAIDVLTEEHIHSVAKKQALQAERFWEREEQAETIELSTLTGQTKRTVVVPNDTFDPSKEKLVETVIEEEDRVVVTWEAVPLTIEELTEAVRGKRDALLKQTDEMALVDRPISQAMLDYRAALRDIPQQEGFPTDITWPILPID